ncbi:MAG: hypothetical protein AAF125_08395 [Chloroflexota bacterium]
MSDITLRELTDDERLDAKATARDVLRREIGDKPARDAFQNTTVREYPSWVTRLVGGLMLLVFAAAAMPSLFRLYEAGYTYHLQGIDNPMQAAVVGVSTFLLAEFLIITSTLAASIFYRGRARAVFAIPIGLGLAVAFVGNWTVVQPHDLFAWLETLVPPLAVLVMSFVGERLILDAVRQQHSDERAYQEALTEWQAEQSQIEDHPRWRVVYGRALVTALREANTGGAGTRARQDLMNGMSRRQWAGLVRHEMEIERGEWLTEEGFDDEPPTALVIQNGHSEGKALAGEVVYQNPY